MPEAGLQRVKDKPEVGSQRTQDVFKSGSPSHQVQEESQALLLIHGEKPFLGAGFLLKTYSLEHILQARMSLIILILFWFN